MSNVLNRLQRAASLVRNNQVKSEALRLYVRSKLDLSLNYAINVVFYLTLRARRIPVSFHPVVRRLLQYRDLLQKLKPVEEEAEKQIDELFQLEEQGKLTVVMKPGQEKKGKLDLVAILKKQKDKTKESLKERGKSKKKPKKELAVTWEDEVMAESGAGKRRGKKSESEEADNSDEDDDGLGLPLPKDEGKDEGGNEDEKRAITWQMAKNKGLTPKRKKEQRNPRVKYRNRFRKAKIRRKGQVREVRSELQKYGGEMSGIKATVTKSIKFTG